MWQQILALILMVAAFFVLVIIIDGNRFVIRKYHINIPALRKEARFILLSDLHNKDYGNDNEKLIRAIKRINPDGIIIAGDMVSAAKREGDSASHSLLLKLCALYPVYYGNGNHESKIERHPEVFGPQYNEYKKSLKRAGVKFLLNERAYLPEFNLHIHGLETYGEYYRKFFSFPMEKNYLGKQLGVPDKRSANLLIAHNPEYFEDYAKWGADIVVSGHVHGGMIRLPFFGGVISPKLSLFPKYDGGLFEKNNTTMIVSRGVGDHCPNIRIFNPAELVVIELKP